MHINPDHFLETAAGRVTTHERNNQAWRSAYRSFHEELAKATTNTEIYVLVGAQGSGKSTWAKRLACNSPHAIIFDAILVKHRERTPILAAAEAKRVKTIAVWFNTPLEICLARNAARPPAEVVPEQALRNVFAIIEPPSLSEGFERVIEIDPLAADPAVPAFGRAHVNR
jgi:energy-coupling factor transporter ATP-binding protein EcfA2